MGRIIGQATLTAGTGAKQINVGQLLTSVELTVGEKNTADSISHRSVGKYVDGGTARCVSTMADGTNGDTVNSSSKIIRHYEKVGGVWTVVFEAEISSFSGTHINLNVIVGTNSDDYPMLIDGLY